MIDQHLHGWIPNHRDAIDLDIEQDAAAKERYRAALDVVAAGDDHRDVFAYRALVDVCRRSRALASRWLAVDGTYRRLVARSQGAYGLCVGFASATILDIRAALDIVAGGDAEYLPALYSADGMYGLARMAAGDTSRGDGCYGSAAIRAMIQLGTLHQMQYQARGSTVYDLRRYSGKRGREFGSSWNARAYQPLWEAARKRRVDGYYRVRSGEEAWTLAGLGYPWIMCSSVGFAGKRDADGAIEPRGRWMHAMAGGLARRTTASGRKLILVMNSYGNDWTSGPYFADQPLGSFYADVEVIDRMVRHNDSWAIVGVEGFEAKGELWAVD